MINILLSGANGYLATSFCQLFAGLYKSTLLSHRPTNGHITLGELRQNPELVSQTAVVINLAGANIGEQRWTPARKQLLLSSRLNTTSQLVEIFNQAGATAHFISASAVGIYEPQIKHSDMEQIDYSHEQNFSQTITKQWEQAALKYRGPLTITRFGVVLGSKGGAFPQMLRPFLWGMGGKLGTGQQYFSWIALTDLLNALAWIIHERKTGVYTLVAPEQITNEALSQHISQLWHRPAWMNLPEFMINLLFGQMGRELFLASLQVSPDKLIQENFQYTYPDIAECLNAIKTQRC